jgi:hypothetical protein
MLLGMLLVLLRVLLYYERSSVNGDDFGLSGETVARYTVAAYSEAAVAATTDTLLNGRVLQEFASRVLPRRNLVVDVVLIGELASNSVVKELCAQLRHTVHVLVNESHSVDELWWDMMLPKKLGWVLLLFVDGGGGEEKSIKSMRKFLSESTVTYIVFRSTPDLTSAAAIQVLLDAKYKVQIMACTHYLGADFGPNVLLTTSNIPEFARATRAAGAHTYLFATQGFDLAIPSARTFLSGLEPGDFKLKTCSVHQAIAAAAPAEWVPPPPLCHDVLSSLCGRASTLSSCADCVRGLSRPPASVPMSRSILSISPWVSRRTSCSTVAPATYMRWRGGVTYQLDGLCIIPTRDCIGVMDPLSASYCGDDVRGDALAECPVECVSEDSTRKAWKGAIANGCSGAPGNSAATFCRRKFEKLGVESLSKEEWCQQSLEVRCGAVYGSLGACDGCVRENRGWLSLHGCKKGDEGDWVHAAIHTCAKGYRSIDGDASDGGHVSVLQEQRASPQLWWDYGSNGSNVLTLSCPGLSSAWTSDSPDWVQHVKASWSSHPQTPLAEAACVRVRCPLEPACYYVVETCCQKEQFDVCECTPRQAERLRSCADHVDVAVLPSAAARQQGVLPHCYEAGHMYRSKLNCRQREDESHSGGRYYDRRHIPYTPADGVVTCATRIVPPQLPLGPISGSAAAKRPNLLVLLIDPVSTPQFHRLLPRTAALLSSLGYLRYNHYAVVGANSGPNQVALYAGEQLKSRDGVAGDNSRWLWDRLRKVWYAHSRVPTLACPPKRTSVL